jgi:NAD(P)H-hydrate repair Nnr-like enzyme with NAD(P)H-hydrate dehydratase domain
VLSGIIGTLLAQGLSPIEAAGLGAWLHGMAGDKAAEALTPVCLIAEDLLGWMPEAVRSLTESDQRD